MTMRTLSILLITILSTPAFGQQWLRVDSVFNPSGVGVQNFSAPAFADLNGDRKPDLLLGNGSSARVGYFRNLGTGLPPKFLSDTTVLSSIYASGMAGTNSDYPAPVDLDGDGRIDLVIGGFNGLLYYRNAGDTLFPVWQRVDSVFGTSVNSLIGSDPKPAFADLDNDGDLDLLVGIGESLLGGPTPGITMGFRNTGSRTAPRFTLDSSLVAGIPDIGLNSYPALADMDNDGDLDLLLGRDLQTFVYFRNTGTASGPVWTANSTTFTGIETSTYWKNPTLFDLDGDGDFDLLYGTSDGTLYYYENVGSRTAPQFSRNTAYFPVIRTAGNAATTSFGDFDGDGDLDMISGDWLGGIQYFRNDGTASSPRFTKTTAPFTSIDVGSYSSPKFVDLDGDGDLDIVSGALDGRIFCYINNGTSFTQNTTIFAAIDVGWRSAPAFADIDNDGDLDMIVGAEDAPAIAFYRNQGSNVFVQENGVIAGVTSVRNGHPAFVDLDHDGDVDLVIGGSNGRLLYYENTGTRTSPVWTRNDAWLAGMSVRQDAAAAFADFDGDRKPDAIIGEYNGNFSFFKNQLPTAVVTQHPLPDSFILHQNYPNPFNPGTVIRFTVPVSSPPSSVSLRVYDVTGREVATLVNEMRSPGEHAVAWDGSEVASGVYWYELRSGPTRLTRKMMLMK